MEVRVRVTLVPSDPQTTADCLSLNLSPRDPTPLSGLLDSTCVSGCVCPSEQTQPHGDMAFRKLAVFQLHCPLASQEDALGQGTNDTTIPGGGWGEAVTFQQPGRHSFGLGDLSSVSESTTTLPVRRWTSYLTSLTRGILASEIWVMMLTSEHCGGLNEIIYVKTS